jgi:hypothetical protein
VFIILGVFPSECVYVCQDFSRFSGNWKCFRFWFSGWREGESPREE